MESNNHPQPITEVPKGWKPKSELTVEERMRLVRADRGIQEDDSTSGVPSRVFVCRSADVGSVRKGNR